MSRGGWLKWFYSHLSIPSNQDSIQTLHAYRPAAVFVDSLAIFVFSLENWQNGTFSKAFYVRHSLFCCRWKRRLSLENNFEFFLVLFILCVKSLSEAMFGEIFIFVFSCKSLGCLDGAQDEVAHRQRVPLVCNMYYVFRYLLVAHKIELSDLSAETSCVLRVIISTEVESTRWMPEWRKGSAANAK